MYAKFTDADAFEIISRPNWFMDDGSSVTDEFLAGEGILPIEDIVPEYDPVTQLVTLQGKEDWVVTETEVLKTYLVTTLTIEEQRARYPRLGMVDFRSKLRGVKVVQRYYGDGSPWEELDGIYEDDILEKIGMIADRELSAEARDYFLYAQYIERTNDWVDILGSMFDLTPLEIDAIWLA